MFSLMGSYSFSDSLESVTCDFRLQSLYMYHTAWSNGLSIRVKSCKYKFFSFFLFLFSFPFVLVITRSLSVYSLTHTNASQFSLVHRCEFCPCLLLYSCSDQTSTTEEWGWGGKSSRNFHCCSPVKFILFVEWSLQIEAASVNQAKFDIGAVSPCLPHHQPFSLFLFPCRSKSNKLWNVEETEFTAEV